MLLAALQRVTAQHKLEAKGYRVVHHVLTALTCVLFCCCALCPCLCCCQPAYPRPAQLNTERAQLTLMASRSAAALCARASAAASCFVSAASRSATSVLSADSGESILPVIDEDRRICSNKRNQRDAREEPEAFCISTHRQSDSMKADVCRRRGTSHAGYRPQTPKPMVDAGQR